MELDAVVVGAGAAGCVVASRLAGSGSRTVLLLEAGPDLGASPPEGILDGWHMTRLFDWGYESEPDESGAVQTLRRVRLVGGTSSIVRFAVRGAPADYAEWEALGNPGWGYEDVLPYFTRLETDVDFGDQAWHGDSGPIPITRYRDLERTEIHAAMAHALAAVGFPAIEDHNRPGAVGVGPMPMSSRAGRRATTASAYLPLADPQKLAIRADSLVSDVIFDGTRAHGVRLVDGTVIEAGCVVLCAGTYGSPPILMRSGIGPADHLASVGIPVRFELSGVGANLADHPDVDLDSGYRGAARAAPLLHTIATFHSSETSTDAPPDLMLWVSDPEPQSGSMQASVDVVLLKPRSRGRVRLRSSDPSDPPRIDLPHLEDPFDVQRLAEGYRRAQEVASRPTVRQLCSEPLAPEIDGENELRSVIRRTATSIPHVVGTCAMGPRPDEGGVVDASGRVHGTEGLFIVDASIMPTVPSGFTHLPTIMIAERLSEHIAARF